jgi:hypothetical protein
MCPSPNVHELQMVHQKAARRLKVATVTPRLMLAVKARIKRQRDASESRRETTAVDQKAARRLKVATLDEPQSRNSRRRHVPHDLWWDRHRPETGASPSNTRTGWNPLPRGPSVRPRRAAPEPARVTCTTVSRAPHHVW